MPTLPTRFQQPKPVNPQVPIPNKFPEIPKDIQDRFPSAVGWQKRLDDFWTRSNQAIQEAQQQSSAQANSTVIYSVDRFLIYQGNNPVPMFSLDDTGIRLGNVLVINTPGSKVYIGAGNYANDDTPFYIDTLGQFSLGASLTWDPDTDTLTITGIINATSGTIGGFTIGADYIRDVGNTFGLASTVTGGDDVRFWAGDTFANRATAPFRITESGVGELAGFLFTTGGFTAGTGDGSIFVSSDPTGLVALGLSTGAFLYAEFNSQQLLFLNTSNAVTAILGTFGGTSGSLQLYPGGGTAGLNMSGASGGSIVFAGDTNLYRSAADTLKTDDSLVVAIGIETAFFQISSAAANAVIRIGNTATGVGAGNGLALSIDAAGANSYLYQYENIPLIIGTNGTDRMIIAAAGGVRIHSLAGVGTRNVVADASGNLTAP